MRSRWRVLSTQFTEVTVVVGDLMGAVVILIIVVLNDALGFTQKQHADRGMTAFKRAALAVAATT